MPVGPALVFKLLGGLTQTLKYMFENETLVDLLRFDKVVQARTKDLSKGSRQARRSSKPAKRNLSRFNR